jgi:tetratricopeptide (TPR) repeat protein
MLQFRENEKLTDVLRLLTKFDAIGRYNPSAKESIRPFQKTLPHCMAVIDQLKDPDLLATRLVLTVARYFVETENRFEKGEAYLKLARQWTEDWDHPIKGRIAFLQGIIKFREVDLQKEKDTKRQTLLQAMAFFNEARTIFLQQNNDDLYLAIEQNSNLCTKKYQRAIALQYKAQTFRELGQLAEAERIFQQALEEYQVIAQGKDHFDIARIFREQALILQIKGELDASLQKFEEAISMQERVYGNTFLSQPTVGATFRYLGSLLRDRGELTKADKAYQKAILVNEAAYQTEIHSYIAHLYHLRAELFFLQGNTFLTEKMEKKSQEIYELLENSHF